MALGKINSAARWELLELTARSGRRKVLGANLEHLHYLLFGISISFIFLSLLMLSMTMMYFRRYKEAIYFSFPRKPVNSNRAKLLNL
jgi:hypothetical protein